MAVEVNDLWFVHSGGATNFSPLADLGGAISTHANKRVTSQEFSGISQITGVTINDAYGNPEGAGSLSFVYNGGIGRTLSWKPYGVTNFYGETVDTSGTYVIGSSSGYLEVTVVVGSLPTSDKADTLGVNNKQENIFPAVGPNASLVGAIQHRCLYVLNTNGVDTATDVKLWIAANTPGGDDIAIGLDPAGLNATATSIGVDTDVPTGVVFTQPSSSGAGLSLGNIPAGGRYAFWQRRTVPPETRGTVISNGAKIALSVLV